MGTPAAEKAPPRWLEWAREIHALSQTGLAFSTGPYDIQRYRRLAEIAAEIVSAHTALELPVLTEAFLRQPGYATPKVDVRGVVIRDNTILLVKERADGLWTLPGGWADVTGALAEDQNGAPGDPVRDATVTISFGDKAYTALTDPSGRFRARCAVSGNPGNLTVGAAYTGDGTRHRAGGAGRQHGGLFFP